MKRIDKVKRLLKSKKGDMCMLKVIRKDNTKRNKFFEELCCKTQKQMKKYLAKELKNRNRKVEEGNGYVYSPGSIPILLCAHIDTVHKQTPREIIYHNGKITSPQGIGGDDRCGIYMILKIIRDLDCHVVFLEDEEIGGKGADKFVKTETCKSLKGKLNYIIELDRMNSNDAVYYNCDNEDFVDFVEQEFWKYSYGSYTDICTICPVVGVAGVNLSCGYYKQHTDDEYVVLPEMETAIRETKKLIKRTTPDDVYEYIEAKNYFKGFYSKYFYGYDTYDDYFYNYKGSETTASTSAKDNMREYEIGFEMDGEEYMDVFYGRSEAEALGHFMTAYDKVCYKDVLYVY